MPEPSTPTRGTEHVDVLIVGSGPAGCTYARVIGDALPDASILVVEVGPKLSPVLGEHTRNMAEADRLACELMSQGPDAGVARGALALNAVAMDAGGVVDQLFVFPGLFLVGSGAKVEGEFGFAAASMCSGVGGMGVHWGGSCPRPTSTERISLIPEPERDAAYTKAEQLLRVSKDLHGEDEVLARVRDVVAAEFDRDAPGGPPVGFMPVALARDADGKLRTGGPWSILGDLAQRVAGFEIRAETLARRILVENGAAVGAQLVDRGTGASYDVRARRVVVCADSLRTPQLLFASGVRPRALGHYLNDHFQMPAFTKLKDEFVSAAPAARGMGSVLIPFIGGVRPMQGQVVLLSRVGIDLGLGDALGPLDPSELAILPWYGAKDIHYTDAVEFSETETDFYGMPAMTIHYTLTDADRRNIELLRANAERSANLIGDLLAEPKLAPGGSSLHYQGTVRMGAHDDGDSVCDTYCRVWGVENLYVGGNGVIPTSTSANPTLTNVALATRAAAQLALSLGAADTATDHIAAHTTV